MKAPSEQPILLITGAGRGIGAATALLAASQGYAVVVNFLHDAAAADGVVANIREAGGQAIVVQGDVSKVKDVRRIFDEAEAGLGPVDFLVNNAGITGGLGPFAAVRPEALEAVLDTNVLGVMFCAQEALRRWQASGTRGVIVNVSSGAAQTGSPGEYVHYAASKAAVDAFTVGLGREVAPQGIRVCGVAPGMTLTDIHAAAGEPDRPARVAPRIPLRRLAAPEEIAEAIVWLLSPAASYVTATTLQCSGGLTS
ncbi:SDR family oxidoreductase [Deinococcus frigens]|uniref:SDR family oxidoreductase n=1 Tax=Deinococcus frigens TaxID=249403 RepID=UPI000497046E|nr:SDR family oxidoreductase [Deinococcus frigens]